MFQCICRLFVIMVTLFVFSACNRHTSKGSSLPNSGSSSSSGDINLSGMENDILYYINQYRKSAGKTELKMINAASTEAAKHSNAMASRNTGFGHQGFEIRVTNISRQIGPVSAAAENVAYGKLTAQQVVNGWLKSPGHKKNIDGNYTLSGIGVAKDNKGVIFFTQIFLRK